MFKKITSLLQESSFTNTNWLEDSGPCGVRWVDGNKDHIQRDSGGTTS